VLSAGACKGLLQALAEQFAAETGADLDAQFGAVGAMRAELESGVPCDVVILTAAMIAELAEEGVVLGESIVPLGSVPTGIAVRDGDDPPAVDSEAALKQALLAASALYVPDTSRSTAGLHVAHMLRELGIAEAVSARLFEYPNGAAAMRALAESDDAGAIGCTQVTEIKYTQGVRLVAPLPAAFALSTVYAMAVCREAPEPELARALSDLLTSRVAEDLRRDGGFELLNDTEET